MKKLLVIILILSSLNSFSQTFIGKVCENYVLNQHYKGKLIEYDYKDTLQYKISIELDTVNHIVIMDDYEFGRLLKKIKPYTWEFFDGTKRCMIRTSEYYVCLYVDYLSRFNRYRKLIRIKIKNY